MKKESGIIIENNKNPSILILNGSDGCNDSVDKLNKSELTDVMKRIRLLEESLLSAQKELGINLNQNNKNESRPPSLFKHLHNCLFFQILQIPNLFGNTK